MDIVELFAQQGNDITVIERLPQLAQDLDPLSRQAVFALMNKHSVKALLATTLMEVKDGTIALNHADGTLELPYDFCLICLGMASNNRHMEEMAAYYAEKGVAFLNIGDSSRPRKIIAACEEGRNILLVLDRLGRLN